MNYSLFPARPRMFSVRTPLFVCDATGRSNENLKKILVEKYQKGS